MEGAALPLGGWVICSPEENLAGAIPRWHLHKPAGDGGLLTLRAV